MRGRSVRATSNKPPPATFGAIGTLLRETKGEVVLVSRLRAALEGFMTRAEHSSGWPGAFRGCSSWDDIQGKLHGLPEKEKGDLFEQLVKAYLLLEPEYASKLKHVWLQREVPQAVSEKLRLPATDQGIDLVAETHDGEFWAIQCKYRQTTDRSLTWREISTFTGLAFWVCR